MNELFLRICTLPDDEEGGRHDRGGHCHLESGQRGGKVEEGVMQSTVPSNGQTRNQTTYEGRRREQPTHDDQQRPPPRRRRRYGVMTKSAVLSIVYPSILVLSIGGGRMQCLVVIHRHMGVWFDCEVNTPAVVEVVVKGLIHEAGVGQDFHFERPQLKTGMQRDLQLWPLSTMELSVGFSLIGYNSCLRGRLYCFDCCWWQM